MFCPLTLQNSSISPDILRLGQVELTQDYYWTEGLNECIRPKIDSMMNLRCNLLKITL